MPLLSGTHPNVGNPAPDFTLPDQSGEEITLSKLRGKRVVLYFFPKADTPGWTIEAQAFRDEGPKLPKDAVVLGVSKDTVEAQAKFAKKNALTFRLLADAKGKVIKLYGVDGLLGYSKRQSFLIDSKGKIAKVYEKVSPARHAAEVKEALESVS
jgi:thioredoxin-dependent peroxiredoxin